MGNITALKRYQAGTLIDSLIYGYTLSGKNTNMLQSVVDNSGSNAGLANGTTGYLYDGNGNMLSATNSINTGGNKSFTYNILNLPATATFATGSATFAYDAAGNKLRKASTAGSTTTYTDYIAGIQYTGTTSESIAFIQTEEGKAVPNGTTGYDYTYYLGDNLGNTRVTFDTKNGYAESQQVDDYYPFGLEINRTPYTPKNEYLYNRKELQEEFGEYDYGARFYDPVVARWTTVDPLATKYPWYTPYQFAGNEVPNAIDRDGMEPAYPHPDGNYTVARDGDLQKPLTDPDGSAYEASQKPQPGSSDIHRDPVASIAVDVLGPLGEALNTLFENNPTPTTTSQKVAAVITVIQSIPLEGGEGGGGVEGGGFEGGGPKLPDHATVVRGGLNTPEAIASGTGTHPSGVTGVSVNAGVGPVEEIAVGIKHGKVGVTTVGDVRAAGGDVIRSSGATPLHATLTGVAPELASKLLNPVVKNPALKK